jgi:hypothetical protein
MQKALPLMNIMRQHVVSELTGVTGMAMIRAMPAGERNPVLLAQLRGDRCHQDREALAKALPGQSREEHLLALAQAMAPDGGTSGGTQPTDSRRITHRMDWLRLFQWTTGKHHHEDLKSIATNA